MGEYFVPVSTIMVAVLTGLVLLGVWLFGKFLIKENALFSDVNEGIIVNIRNLTMHGRSDNASTLNSWINYLSECLEKRNDFWTSYGQMVICIFIVGILAILLLTKTISAEAGLPILSAISGFAIAKSATTTRKSNDIPSNPPRNGE